MVLEEIIDLETLQEIQDCFSKATGFAAITVDYRGQPLLKYSGFTKFCQKLRETSFYNDKCCGCDAHGSLEAARRGKVHIYYCHAGLVDFSIPIVVNGAYMGAIMGGQISTDDKPSIDSNLINKNENIFEKYPEFEKYYNEVEKVSFKRISESANLLSKSLELTISESILKKENERLSKLYEEKIQQEQELNQTYLNTYKSKTNHKFFFNALNIAGKQAFLENGKNTEEIIYAVADIYRYYLKDYKKFTTLKKEIKNIKNYAFVQNVRFGEFLKFNINAPTDVLEHKFPPLVLQIFVENSFTHGLEPKEYFGTIDINIIKKSDRIFFTIEDDGVSIDKEECNKFNNKTYFNTLPKDEEGRGIHDAYNRLNYFFKEDFHLSFEPKKKGGTKVVFDIPAL